MKLLAMALVALIALKSSAASAEKWIQYDVEGYGYFDSASSEWEDTVWDSGKVKFNGSFIVDVDPGAGELPYGFSGYYGSDGVSYQENYNDHVNEIRFNAFSTESSLVFDYESGSCGTYTGCEDIFVSLFFAPGSLEGLPDRLPRLKSGNISYYLGGRYGYLEAEGVVWRAKATEVSGPGGAGLGLTFSTPAVPEPSTWTAMLAGFGIVGAMMRYRKTAVR